MDDNYDNIVLDWWYSNEYIKLVKDTTEGKVVWSIVGERQDQLKESAVERKDYNAAAFHRDLRDFAKAKAGLQDAKGMYRLAAQRLLYDICSGDVRWDAVFVKHDDLMLTAASKDLFEAAAFHRNIKDYAESIYTNQPAEEAPGPGQAGGEGVVRGEDQGRP